jgi:hypothetical protein
MQARLRQMSVIAMVAAALVLVLGGMAFAQGNPIIGTWKLNLAKSSTIRDRHR